MFLTLINGQREVFDGYWKPSCRYIIARGEARRRAIHLTEGMLIGFGAGFLIGLVLIALDAGRWSVLR